MEYEMARKKGRSPKAGRVPIPIFEEPGKRYYFNRLNWILEFLNADIQSLTPGEFLKLFYDFLSIIYEGYDRETLAKLCKDTLKDRTALQLIQEEMREYFEKLTGFNPSKESIPFSVAFDVNLEKDRLTMKPSPVGILLKKDWPDDDDGEREPDCFTPEWHARQLLKTILYREPHEEMETYGMKFFGRFTEFYDERIDNRCRFTLVSILQKIPLSFVGRCPDCSKYFKKTSKKKTDLCPRCLRKRTTYKWRVDNREEYNTYQRNLQKGVKTSVKEIREDLRKQHNGREVNNGQGDL
jgi:hypothetical protein